MTTFDAAGPAAVAVFVPTVVTATAAANARTRAPGRRQDRDDTEDRGMVTSRIQR
jgi:hypothetical protein